MESSTISFEVQSQLPFEQVIEQLTAALKEEGFGILTRIDVHSTLKEKIGADFRQYAILGACNPKLAYTALEHKSEVGLMLPCNITVEDDDRGGSIIRVGDPEAMLKGFGLDQDEVFSTVGHEARTRLERVAKKLQT